MVNMLLENVHTQLGVRTLKRRDEPTLETCEQTIHHALQLYRRAVGSKNNALVVTEEMVETVP